MRKIFTTIAITIIATTMAQAQLKVTSTGTVGIGTQTPYANSKLDVQGNVFVPYGSSFWVGNTDESKPRLRMHHAGLTGDAYIDFLPNLHFRNGYTDAMYISSLGNVSIGGTSTISTDKFSVFGNTKFTGNTVLAGKTTFAGWTSLILDWSMPGGYPTLYGDNGAFYLGTPTKWLNHIYVGQIDYNIITQYSDKRLKENIKELSPVLSQIKKLNSYTYNYNDILYKGYNDKDKAKIKKTQYGFVAQELKDIFPELVLTDDSTGYLKVNYVSMIPILAQAIKEQIVTIDNLQDQVSSLSNQLTEIKNCCKSSGSKTKSYVETDNTDATIVTNQTTKPVLYQNSPNPFKQSTTIKLELPQTIGSALVCVYDLTGRQLKCFTVTERGNTSVQITASELSAGMYHYALIADGNLIDTKTMVLTE